MENRLGENVDLSQFYLSEDGYWWDEVSSYFSRASSNQRKESTSVLSSSRNVAPTSFDDFQESVNDAWDLGDDEFCVISGIKLHALFLK